MMCKEPENLDAESNPIPFTSRLIALYRALETRREDALFIDPFAERLAGDMSEYKEKHRRTTSANDSAIVRTYFIDQNLLEPWCEKNKDSQIVILGAGLDTRAYRFQPLKKNSHAIFEIDFEVVNNYKERLLKDETPFCDIRRISADLSQTGWANHLLNSGFSAQLPTFWILEGLVYYLPRDVVVSLLRRAAELSTKESQVFVDVCNPGLADLDYGPFSTHFEWGISLDDIPQFFSSSGWIVSASYFDDHDQGRDVGQKGMMFVYGNRKKQLKFEEYLKEESPSSESVGSITDLQIQDYSQEVSEKIIPAIENITQVYAEDPVLGTQAYIEFLRDITPFAKRIVSALSDAASVGQISPRLLRNPLSTGIDAGDWSSEEVESHMIGYLTAIISLVYCGIHGLEGWQFSGNSLHKASVNIQSIGDIEQLFHFIKRTGRLIQDD